MSGNDKPGLSFDQTVKAITEFIEVAMHTILYVRHVYPAELFVRRKKYDTAVFQSRHPGLNEYINNCCEAIGREIAQENVSKVVIIIKDQEDTALERYIFAVENMVQVEAFNKDRGVVGGLNAASLGKHLRGFMTKLTMVESQVTPLPVEEPTFTVVIELKDDTIPVETPNEDPPPWIPANKQHTTSGTKEASELHYIRMVETGVINLLMTVQESAEKLQKEKELQDSQKLTEAST